MDLHECGPIVEVENYLIGRMRSQNSYQVTDLGLSCRSGGLW